MAVITKKVTYTDGREPVEVRISPRAQVMTERHIGGDWSAMAVLGTYYMTWATLVKSDPSGTPDFETWLDQVDEVEDVKVEQPDPTQPDPFGDNSSS